MLTVRSSLTGTVSLLLASFSALVACGAPPELMEEAQATPPPRPTISPGSPPVNGAPLTPAPTATASMPAFSEYTAVDCAGRPGADAVISLLRRTTDLLPRSLRVKVMVTPRCAGDWQYTVLEVTGREPLQVVSKGPANDLELVTAGTDVCSIPVRVAAPAGIRSIACDSGAVPGAGL